MKKLKQFLFLYKICFNILLSKNINFLSNKHYYFFLKKVNLLFLLLNGIILDPRFIINRYGIKIIFFYIYFFKENFHNNIDYKNWIICLMIIIYIYLDQLFEKKIYKIIILKLSLKYIMFLYFETFFNNKIIEIVVFKFIEYFFYYKNIFS